MRLLYFSELITLVFAIRYFSIAPSAQVSQTNNVPLMISNSEVELLTQLLESKNGFTNPEFSRLIVREQTGLSLNRVSEIVNAKFNCNFNTWVNDRRIAEAKSLLEKAPDLSIKEIYFEVGFNSKSAFNKAFKTSTGRTPSDFKQSVKKSTHL